MPSVPDEPAELDPADVVDEDELEEISDHKTTIKRPFKPKSIKSRPPEKAIVPVPAAPASRTAAQRAFQSSTFPEVDVLVAEARKRAESAGQVNDRVALSRARTELALVLEVVKGDLPAALAEYRAAHAIAPSAHAPVAAARRLTPQKPIAPALALLEAELRTNTDERTRAPRLLELARLLFVGGAAPEKTVQTYRDLLAASPDLPAALRGLERALRALPRALENATTLDALASHLEAMASAFRVEPRLSAWLEVERAAILERLRRPDAARAALEGAMQLDGGIGPVRDAYTRHLIAHQNVNLLVDAWAAEARLLGENARAGRLYYAAARLASERLEQMSLAIDLHRRATALSSTPVPARKAALRELSRLYCAVGDVPGAIEAERQLLLWVDEAERGYWQRRLAAALEGFQRWDEVVGYARDALSSTPDDDETRERLDAALASLGRHDQRVSMWTAEASRVTTTSARIDALRRAAQIAERDLRRADLALVELRAAWAIDPEDIGVADGIARLLTPTSSPSLDDPADPARARARIDFYTEAASRAPEPARKVAELERLAQIWEDEVRSPSQALGVYREILAIEPERRSAVLGLARNASRAGNARELFRALVLEADHTKAPALERTLLLRAAEIASADLCDADTAQDLVKRVLAKNAGDPAALRAAARIHQRTGHFEEAVAQLRLLLKHTRKGPAAYAIAIAIAELLEQRLRRQSDALVAYREAHRIDPLAPLPPAEIKRILLASDDHRAVADELCSMAASAPSKEARGQLLVEAAEIFADRLDDPDRAISLLVQARVFLPDEIEIVERLERAYVRQNRLGDLALLLEGKVEKSPSDLFTLGLLWAEDRDIIRATAVLGEVLAGDRKHVPAQRTLEHALARTEQFADLAAVLRLQAGTFETSDARAGAIGELVVLEEHRGVTPPPGAPSAADLLKRILPEDILLHEAVLRRGVCVSAASDVASVTNSLGVLASVAGDAHYAATLALAAALLLERAAGDAEHHVRRDALRRYRLVLEGWPECLTAARGMRRLAERLGDGEALIEAAVRLGSLESEPERRAERLVEAAESIVQQKTDPTRALDLFVKALGEDPNGARGREGLLSLALEGGSGVGVAADALRRALERTSQAEQVARLGAGLARLAVERLKDPTVALEALRRVRKKAPGNVANLLALADLSVSMKLWADAAEIAGGALGITRDPAERLRAAVLVAETHAEIPDAKASARREAEEAEKLADAAPAGARADLLSRLSAVYARLDDKTASDRVLLRAVTCGGGSAAPLALLAKNYNVSTFEGAQAYVRAIDEVIQEARRASIPVEPGWLATMGKVEATLLSKPKEGIMRLKEAIMLDPTRLETYEALAEVYGSLGAHEEAVRELLTILPDVAERGAPLERMVAVFGLFARECKSARRAVQASSAEAVVSYLSRGGASAVTIAASAPVPLSLSPSSLVHAFLPAPASWPWLDVALAIADIAPKVLKIDPAAMGLSPREKLPPRGPHPSRVICDRFARAFGDLRFDLYVDVAQVGVPRILAADPPAIVLPRGYGDLPENEQIAGIGRMLVYLALGVPWLEDLSHEDLEGLLFGALRVGVESWGEGVLSAASDANAEVMRPRIAKAAGRKHKRALEELAERTADYADPKSFRQAVRVASLRAAYCLTGDLASTLNLLMRIDRELAQIPRGEVAQRLFAHPMARDLAFYSLRPETAELRRSIGTA